MSDKTTRRRRIRNTALAVGTITAVGLGCYFGSKRGFEDISKSMKTVENELKKIAIETGNVVYLIEEERSYRANQIANINEALKQGIPFQHFPGLGVRFESIKDLEKVENVG